MQTCPFCRTRLTKSDTFCNACGYSLVLPLPYPELARRKLYFALSILSILSGILSCAFTFVPSLYVASLFFFIGAMGAGGLTLERTRGKCGTLAIKLLALLGLFLGVLGYISFMFIRSNVPSSGYTL